MDNLGIKNIYKRSYINSLSRLLQLCERLNQTWQKKQERSRNQIWWLCNVHILPENFNHSKTIKANIYLLLKKYSILLDPEFVPFFYNLVILWINLSIYLCFVVFLKNVHILGPWLRSKHWPQWAYQLLLRFWPECKFWNISWLGSVPQFYRDN